MYCALHGELKRPLYRIVGWAAFAFALIASISRGPWVGAAAGLCVVYFTGSESLDVKLRRAALGSLLVIGLLALTPYGQKAVDYLPFVGTVDEGSVVYRERVFSVSLQVILQYPLFGAHSYSGSALEELRQGEGIIDIVNAYVGVALGNGLVGLLVYVGVLLASLFTVWRSWLRSRRVEKSLDNIGRALLGGLVAMLVTLATTSMVGLIYQLYWILAGLSAGYALAVSMRAASSGSLADSSYAHTRYMASNWR
ncbi:O-antigen ligase family protein [Aquabacterium sp. J223]|uniref:O-antigen ligase family protein n=1 Tax=Aquabacterium sp. J223 TaxID=2898431 RepID=UPI0021AE2DE6|nr:O-antigen ligase family protein [Aquabacterium sp. J223]UUX96851.1 O-antigen ligase family protein [Aquabacterium sp. J223]